MQVRLKTSSWLSWTGNLNISFVHLSSSDNLNFFVSIFIDNFKIYRSFSRLMASTTGVAKEYTDPLLARGVLCLWTISICLLRKSMVPNLQLNCLDRWDEKAILKTRLELYLIIFPPTLAKSHCNMHFLCTVSRLRNTRFTFKSCFVPFSYGTIVVKTLYLL